MSPSIPQCSDIEKYYLGEIICFRKAFDDTKDIVSKDMFYEECNKNIFAAVDHLYVTLPADTTLSVKTVAEESGISEQYINELYESVNDFKFVEYHARIILQQHIRRCIMETANEMLANSLDPSRDPFVDLELASSRIAKLSRESSSWGPKADPRPEFRLIVAGGRDFCDKALLEERCDAMISEKAKTHTIVIISGSYYGADEMGESYAERRGFDCIKIPADWEKYGKSAGPIRNEKMVKMADAGIFFWDGSSRGTANIIESGVALPFCTKVPISI